MLAKTLFQVLIYTAMLSVTFTREHSLNNLMVTRPRYADPRYADYNGLAFMHKYSKRSNGKFLGNREHSFRWSQDEPEAEKNQFNSEDNSESANARYLDVSDTADSEDYNDAETEKWGSNSNGGEDFAQGDQFQWTYGGQEMPPALLYLARLQEKHPNKFYALLKTLENLYAPERSSNEIPMGRQPYTLSDSKMPQGLAHSGQRIEFLGGRKHLMEKRFLQVAKRSNDNAQSPQNLPDDKGNLSDDKPEKAEQSQHLGDAKETSPEVGAKEHVMTDLRQIFGTLESGQAHSNNNLVESTTDVSTTELPESKVEKTQKQKMKRANCDHCGRSSKPTGQKRSIDWSTYFGYDKRADDQFIDHSDSVIDNNWLENRYKRQARLYISKENTPKVFSADQVDRNMENMEDNYLDDAIKYTGSQINSDNDIDYDRVKNNILARLDEALKIEKLRRALKQAKYL